MSLTANTNHLRVAMQLQKLTARKLAEVLWTAEAIQPSIPHWLERCPENIGNREAA